LVYIVRVCCSYGRHEKQSTNQNLCEFHLLIQMGYFFRDRPVSELRTLIRRLRDRAIFHRHVHLFNRRITKPTLVRYLVERFVVRRVPGYEFRRKVCSRSVDYHFYWHRGRYFVDPDCSVYL
jgi:hypothetical protein